MNTSQSPTPPPVLGDDRPSSWSGSLPEELRNLLDRSRVAVEILDSWTLRLQAVPVSPLFTKPRTNLLLRRLGMATGTCAYVDSDLSYLGPDNAVSLALTGPCRQHWRRLRTPHIRGTASAVLCAVLRLLGSPLADAVQDLVQASEIADRELPPRILAGLAELVSPALAAEAFDSSFRKPLAHQLAVFSSRPTIPRCAILWGRPGCGRDHLMLAAAHPLIESGVVTSLYQVAGARVAAGCVVPQEIDATLMAVLDAAVACPGCLLLIQDLDLCISKTAVARALLCGAIDRGLKFLATARSKNLLGRISQDESLARRVLPIHVPCASREQTLNALQRLSSASAIDVAAPALQVAVRTPEFSKTAQPSTALALMGAALADAIWRDAAQIGPDDVVGAIPNAWPQFPGKK